MNIDLCQIESGDLPIIKTLLSSDFRKFSDINSELTIKDTEDFISSLNSDNSYCFSIKASRDNEYKRGTIGLCYIKSIDWINRHGEIGFMMVDKGGYTATLQNYPASREAFAKLLQFGFYDLALHKLWIEVFSGNKISDVLEDFGFLAEGVRRSAKYKGGQYIDTTICSVLDSDFQQGKI